jgi:hypothetical protein
MATPPTPLDGLESPGVVVLHITDQVFQFNDESGTEWHWNASQGMRIVLAAGREPEAFYPGDSGLDEAQIRRQYPDIDEAYALTTDLTKPILFIPFHDGTHVLIDGWNRLLHAVLKGVPFLLCYTLTEAERDRVLVLKIPPQVKPRRLVPMARPAPKKGGRRP